MLELALGVNGIQYSSIEIVLANARVLDLHFGVAHRYLLGASYAECKEDFNPTRVRGVAHRDASSFTACIGRRPDRGLNQLLWPFHVQ